MGREEEVKGGRRWGERINDGEGRENRVCQMIERDQIIIIIITTTT